MTRKGDRDGEEEKRVGRKKREYKTNEKRDEAE